MLGQFRFDGFVGLGLRRGNLDVFLGAAVGVAALVVHHAAAQRQVGGVLVGLGDRGEHVQAARIGVFLELLVDQLARHLGDVLGVHAERRAVGLDLEFFVFRLLILGVG